jgi:hypothetical protein
VFTYTALQTLLNLDWPPGQAYRAWMPGHIKHRHIFQQVFIGLCHELNPFVEDQKNQINAFCMSAHDGFKSYLLSFCGEN